MPDSPDHPSAPDFEAALLNPVLEQFFSAHEELANALSDFSLEQIAPLIGGMLTMPELQASTIRLEILQHLVVASADGEQKPSASSVSDILNEICDGYAESLEDPAEDVFVSRVSGPETDYLIFSGIYEGSGYYLQRFLNILEGLPTEEPFTGIRHSIYALLTMTNEVAHRAALSAHMVGKVLPLDYATVELYEQACIAADRVMFDHNDLARLGINENDIEAFVFDMERRSELREERLGHSSLERASLLRFGDRYCLALPNSASIAIRRLIIEFCISGGMERHLYRAYAEELAQAFSHTPILGGSPTQPIPFQPMGGLLISNIARYIDQGRLLHLCFVVDDFYGYQHSGVVDFRPDSSVYGSLVDGSIHHIFQSIKSKPEFREGLTLVVLCPWARPMALQFQGVNDPRWRVEMVSASDLEALSWASSFSHHILWSLLDARDALTRLSVKLFNINGLLNLFAWSEQLEGHLVPHGQMLDDATDGSPVIIIPPNSLLEIRRKGAQAWNVHRVRTGDGRIIQVRRYKEDSIFEENSDKPLYVSFDDLQQGQLIAVYETDQRGWWATIDTPGTDNRDFHYRLWHAAVV